MSLTFRMLQHAPSGVTVGKITNKFKRKVRDWYLIRKTKRRLHDRKTEHFKALTKARFCFVLQISN